MDFGVATVGSTPVGRPDRAGRLQGQKDLLYREAATGLSAEGWEYAKKVQNNS